MILTCDKARWYEDSEGFWAAFRTRDRASAAKIAEQMDGAWVVEARKQPRRRSLDANAYLWVLLDKLAAALGQTKEELYRGFIREIGVFRDFHLAPEEAATFEVAWSRLGTGWVTEQVDYTSDGEQVVIRAYYGSSQYNTKQMTRLIRSVVDECKSQEIETMTPDELSSLMDRWGAV